MGCTYCVLAPEHALVAAITTPDNTAAVEAYIKATAGRSDRDRTADAKKKTGVPTGAFAIHPISGAKVPIWVADYVIGGYGTGAVMAVPGHDERDFEFAKAFDLPIVEVVSPDGALHAPLQAAFVDDGVAVNSGEFDGLLTPDCKKAMIEKLASLGRGGARASRTSSETGCSRDSATGASPSRSTSRSTWKTRPATPARAPPTPSATIKPIAVEESELPAAPARDPPISSPGDDPRGPLARAVPDWRFFQKDGKWYARETNTMPQWAGSCWYYLRFTDPQNADEGWSKEAYAAWMPVDLYVGGAEHAVLHLLYSRFWHKVLFDLGHVTHPEPFMKLVHQGMILGEDGEKMSKSRGNVVNPDDIVKTYGADALRLYEMFMGPLEAIKPWQTSQVAGVVRFRDRLYSAVQKSVPGAAVSDDTKKLLHRTIKKVTHDIEAMSFNTAISAMMVFTNHLLALPEIPRDAIAAPRCCSSRPSLPTSARSCGARRATPRTLAYEPWPTWDEALCVDDVVEMPVQVNGKVRGKVTLAKTATEDEARTAALADPGVAGFTAGKTIKKLIYVPGKILNLVVG